jgi:PAS domain S-box-containing protein
LSEARWKAVLESAADGIIVMEAHGRVEAFNPAPERLLGYSAQAMLGRNASEDRYRKLYSWTRSPGACQRAHVIGNPVSRGLRFPHFCAGTPM